MISRVAESCFWLLRYVERTENCARLLAVNRSFVLDAGLEDIAEWNPVLVAAGEHERFAELLGEGAVADGEVVQDYMTWDERNPASIVTSARWARENARTIREVVSLEMWECLNGFWHWLQRGPGKRLYSDDRDAFYQHVKEVSALFQGTCHNTMLHEEPFDFMRLGLLLERAGQTARIMDVHHHMLGPVHPGEVESAVAGAQWVAVLRSCSAIEPFTKRTRGAPGGTRVAEFLLLDDRFPRSVAHCLRRAQNFLRRIRGPGDQLFGARSAAQLDELVARLEERTIDEIFELGLHQELTEVIEATSALCSSIHSEYFDPARTPSEASGSVSEA